MLTLSGYETRMLDALHSAIKPAVGEPIALLKDDPHVY